MALIEAVTTSALARGDTVDGDVGCRVVRLRGDHDLTTVASLAAVLSEAIALDDADLVLEMSAITFMDVSTVTVILRTRSYLRDRSRSLRVRSPSRCARLVLETCQLDVLVEKSPRDPAAVTALGPTVVAQATERRPDVAPSPIVNG